MVRLPVSLCPHPIGTSHQSDTESLNLVLNLPDPGYGKTSHPSNLIEPIHLDILGRMGKSHWLRPLSCVRKVRPSDYEALLKRDKFYYDILHPVTGKYMRHNYYQNGESFPPCDRSQASHMEIEDLRIRTDDIPVGLDAPNDVTWVEDPRMTDDTWIDEHAWGNTINGQLYGVAFVRDIPKMVAGLSEKERQLSLHQWYHPQLKGCASPTELFGPFTTFTIVVRGPNGMIVIRKCKQDTQNMRKTSECRIASTYLVPLCSNPECTHVPITPGNNAVRPDKKWRDAVELSQRGSRWSDIGATPRCHVTDGCILGFNE